MRILFKSPVLVLGFVCLFHSGLFAQSTADKLVATAQIAYYEGVEELGKAGREQVGKLPFALNYFKAEVDGASKGAPYLVYYKTTTESEKSSVGFLDGFSKGVADIIRKEGDENEAPKPAPLPQDTLLDKEAFRAMTQRLGKLFGTDYDMIYDQKRQRNAFGTTVTYTSIYAAARVDTASLVSGFFDHPKDLQYPAIRFKQQSTPREGKGTFHSYDYYIYAPVKPQFPYLGHPKPDLTDYGWRHYISSLPDQKEVMSIRKAQLRGNPTEVKEYLVSSSGEKQLSQHLKFGEEGIMTFQLYQEGSNWLKKEIRPTVEDGSIRSFSMGVDLLDADRKPTGKSFGASYWFNDNGHCTKSNEGKGVVVHELSYNDDGLLTKSVANDVPTEVQYDRHQQMIRMSQGGAVIHLDYDLLGRLTEVKVCQTGDCKAGSITKLEWNDAKRQIEEKTSLIQTGQVAAEITYQFNNQGLLSRMEDSKAKVTYTYEVDQVGNWVKRTTRVQGSSPSSQVHVREISYQD